MKVEAIKVLRDAREILKTGGWIQGKYNQYENNPNKGAHCAMGAIDLASGRLGRGYDSYMLAKRALAGVIKYNNPDVTHYSGSGTIVVAFNDSPGRTADEVLAMFNAAIRSLKEGVA